MVALIAAPVCDAIRLGSIGAVFNSGSGFSAPSNSDFHSNALSQTLSQSQALTSTDSMGDLKKLAA